MKWWKRVLRKRMKRAWIFPKLGSAFIIVRFLYKMIRNSQSIQRTVRRGLANQETKIILEVFNRILKKRPAK